MSERQKKIVFTLKKDLIRLIVVVIAAFRVEFYSKMGLMRLIIKKRHEI